MNLKLRIAFLFSLFVFIILMISSVTIYILNENFRKDEFFKRVENKAKEAAQSYFRQLQSGSNGFKEINTISSSYLPEQSTCILDSSAIFRSVNASNIANSEAAINAAVCCYFNICCSVVIASACSVT